MSSTNTEYQGNATYESFQSSSGQRQKQLTLGPVSDPLNPCWVARLFTDRHRLTIQRSPSAQSYQALTEDDVDGDNGSSGGTPSQPLLGPDDQKGGKQSWRAAMMDWVKVLTSNSQPIEDWVAYDIVPSEDNEATLKRIPVQRGIWVKKTGGPRPNDCIVKFLASADLASADTIVS